MRRGGLAVHGCKMWRGGSKPGGIARAQWSVRVGEAPWRHETINTI